MHAEFSTHASGHDFSLAESKSDVHAIGFRICLISTYSYSIPFGGISQYGVQGA